MKRLASIRLYNTLTRKLEPLRPVTRGEVSLYTCGPTVYGFAHIGNLRTYIFEDILERVLEWNGYKVKRAMNITDVGHLTGDSDAGVDKMEQQARTAAEVKKVAQKYTRAFLQDLKSLNIRVPKLLAPATDFISEQIAIIKQLFKKGYAYQTSQAVYFDVSKFQKYGELSGQSLRQKAVAARREVVTDPEKRNPADFALWFKLVGKFKNHLLRWPSPWGKGFPGWHIECSAISRKLLGQPFDIHAGGVDHIGTHHENEIAQSEAAYGKALARYWLHGEFLIIDQKRMGKSKGNFLTLADVVKKGFNPLAYRYLVLSAHYRSKLNFSWDSLAAATAGLYAIYSKYRDLSINPRRSVSPPRIGGVRGGRFIPHLTSPTLGEEAKAYENAFTEALNDDLNTPRALGVMQNVLRDELLNEGGKVYLLDRFDSVLGLDFRRGARQSLTVPPEVKELTKKREKYRASKQFIQADVLREKIKRLGYVVEDTADGPRVRPK